MYYTQRITQIFVLFYNTSFSFDFIGLRKRENFISTFLHVQGWEILNLLDKTMVICL